MTSRRVIWMLAGLLAAAAAVGAVAVRLPDRPAPAPPDGAMAPAVPALVPAAPGSEVNLADPAAVCQAFAAALFTLDTAVDDSPAAAYRRAAAYTTPELAAALMNSPARLLPAWENLAAHHGRTETQVGGYAGELPPGRAGTAHHAAMVTARPIGAAGWTGRPRRHIVYCTLTQSGPVWRLAGYNLESHQLP